MTACQIGRAVRGGSGATTAVAGGDLYPVPVVTVLLAERRLVTRMLCAVPAL